MPFHSGTKTHKNSPRVALQKVSFSHQVFLKTQNPASSIWCISEPSSRFRIWVRLQGNEGLGRIPSNQISVEDLAQRTHRSAAETEVETAWLTSWRGTAFWGDDNSFSGAFGVQGIGDLPVGDSGWRWSCSGVQHPAVGRAVGCTSAGVVHG